MLNGTIIHTSQHSANKVHKLRIKCYGIVMFVIFQIDHILINPAAREAYIMWQKEVTHLDL